MEIINSGDKMRYGDLQDLISSSSSSRKYFLSLPVKMQMLLHEQNDHIHTAEELHRAVGSAERYERQCKISNGSL